MPSRFELKQTTPTAANGPPSATACHAQPLRRNIARLILRFAPPRGRFATPPLDGRLRRFARQRRHLPSTWRALKMHARSSPDAVLEQDADWLRRATGRLAAGLMSRRRLDMVHCGKPGDRPRRRPASPAAQTSRQRIAPRERPRPRIAPDCNTRPRHMRQRRTGRSAIRGPWGRPSRRGVRPALRPSALSLAAYCRRSPQFGGGEASSASARKGLMSSPPRRV